MPRVKLGDVAREYKATLKQTKGLPVVGLEHITPGELQLEHWDQDVETTFSKGFKKGQVLFGRRRAYLKKAAVAPFDGVCSGDITVIEAIPGKILPNLLPFVIQNDLLFDFAIGQSAGSLSPRVKWEKLRNYEFNLPEYEQQEAMVELLQAAYAAKRAYQKQMEATDELVKSQFLEMFGALDSNEKGWKKEPLKKHAEVLVGYPFPSEGYTEEGIPIVGGYNLMQGYINWADSKHWPDQVGYEQYLLKPGDIVMAMDRPWTGSGFKMAFVEGNALPAILIQRTACIRAKDVTNEFLYAMLNSTWFAEHCDVKGSLVPHISNKDINSYSIFVPPIELQNEFAAFFQQSDKSKFELQESIKRVDGLIKSLMQSEN